MTQVQARAKSAIILLLTNRLSSIILDHCLFHILTLEPKATDGSKVITAGDNVSPFGPPSHDFLVLLFKSTSVLNG